MWENNSAYEGADFTICFNCWVDSTMEGKFDKEDMREFLLFSKAHEVMYQKTNLHKNCFGCAGPMPLGRNRNTGGVFGEF